MIFLYDMFMNRGESLGEWNDVSHHCALRLRYRNKYSLMCIEVYEIGYYFTVLLTYM